MNFKLKKVIIAGGGTGGHLFPAVAIGQELEKEGISVEIIDLRSVRPIDYGTVVESVKKTNRCVVVEEAWPIASIASEIAYHLQNYAFDYLDAPINKINSADVPMPYSSVLEKLYLPQVEDIIKAIEEVCYI